MTRTCTQTKTFLKTIFEQAVNSVTAAEALPPALPIMPPKGQTLILGAGKAAAAMAEIAQRRLDYPLRGMVVTRYGHECRLPDETIEVISAAHPVPDMQSNNAALNMLAMAQACTPDDRLIFLASGGGSSVLALPAPGISFSQKQDVVRHLLHSGARISQINCVRKHLSAIKGGRLAAISGTPDVQTFIISDVVGDDPAAIASGPTIADPTTLADARTIIEQYGTPHEKTITAALFDPANETPKPGSVPGRHSVIAKAADALDCVTHSAQKSGWTVKNLGDHIEGEARDIGAAHAKLALSLQKHGQQTLLISGGETTVTVRHKNGCGGRNLEYLAGLALGLNGAPGIIALACDTDGIDGSEDNAGAFVTPTTLTRASSCGMNLLNDLDKNQTYRFFEALDDLIITGPTLTNVNDMRIIAIQS